MNNPCIIPQPYEDLDGDGRKQSMVSNFIP